MSYDMAACSSLSGGTHEPSAPGVCVRRERWACGVRHRMTESWHASCRGGMFCAAKKGYTEEDYYFSEWTAAERENGEHLAVVKFVRFHLCA